MPPINLFMMANLSMGDTPLSTDDADAELVTCFFWPQLVEYYKGIRGVLASWFEKNYVWATNQSTLADIDSSTHAFLIYMLTRFIFCGKRDWIYFHLLSTLEDLAIVGTYRWGRSTLERMYANMNEISAR